MTRMAAVQICVHSPRASGCSASAGGLSMVHWVREGSGKCRVFEPSWPQSSLCPQQGRTVQPARPGGVAPALRQVIDAAGPPGSGAQAGKLGSR